MHVDNNSGVEVVEVILCCLDDPVSVGRAESVSQLWRSVVRNMVRKGKLKKTKRTLRRLKITESFNESSCIKETRLPVFQVLLNTRSVLTMTRQGQHWQLLQRRFTRHRWRSSG